MTTVSTPPLALQADLTAALARIATLEGNPAGVTDVFLSAGQSNEVTQNAPLAGSPVVGHPDVLQFGNDYVLRQAVEPIDSQAGQVDTVSSPGAAGHSSLLKMLTDIRTARGGRYCVVPSAKGGSSIAEWQPSASAPFDRATLFGSATYRAQVAAAASRGVIRGITWYQGESNATGSATYRADFLTMLTAFRTYLGFVPIISTQLCLTHNGTTVSDWSLMRDLQRRMEGTSGSVDAVPRNILVCAHDLSLQSDFLHLDQAAVIELGRRRALAARERIYGEQINGTGPRLVSVTRVTSTQIRVKTTRTINDHANYDHYWTVTDGGTARTLLNGGIASVGRDPGDTTAVLINMAAALASTVTIGYNPTQPRAAGVMAVNVVKDSDGLPLPCMVGVTVP